MSLLFTGESGVAWLLPRTKSRASNRIENNELTPATIQKMRFVALLDGCTNLFLSCISIEN
jgi:hypothetical protein